MRAKNHHIPVRSLVDAALNYNDNICASLIRSKELLVALRVLSFIICGLHRKLPPKILTLEVSRILDP